MSKSIPKHPICQSPPPPRMTEKILKNNTLDVIMSFLKGLNENDKKVFYTKFAKKYKNTDKLLEIIENCKSLEEHKDININIKNMIEDYIIGNQNVNNNNMIDKKQKKKKPISAAIKRLVWNTHIGEDIGKYKCLCCKTTDITQMSFNCGHIIAEANGGEAIVSNLKPICQNCNSSMGTKNMNDFMNSFK
jgi:5-methylcytosine-specific restriction endonuclease McrA